MSEREGLLDEIVDELILTDNQLDYRYLMKTIFIMLTVFAFAFPKIYIQQQIYYKSISVAKLKSEYDILKKENKIIRASIEEIRFKDTVFDVMF